MNQLSEMEFITTTRGARSLLHEGYMYTLNRRTADGHTYWRCHDRSCPGRAVTDSNDQLVSCNDKHSHPPQPAERAVEIVKEKMKKRAREDSTPEVDRGEKVRVRVKMVPDCPMVVTPVVPPGPAHWRVGVPSPTSTSQVRV